MQGFRHRGTCKFLVVDFLCAKESAKGEKSLPSTFQARRAWAAALAPPCPRHPRAAFLRPLGSLAVLSAGARLGRLRCPGCAAPLQRRFQHSSASRAQCGLSFALGEQGQPCPAGPAGSSPAAAGAEQLLLTGDSLGLSVKMHQHL